MRKEAYELVTGDWEWKCGGEAQVWLGEERRSTAYGWELAVMLGPNPLLGSWKDTSSEGICCSFTTPDWRDGHLVSISC